MKSSEAPGRHLTPDEIVDRVFPIDEQPAPVPLHLAACADCQRKLSQLREGWLLDRGAVAGVVDALPDAFWSAQTASILAGVAVSEPAESPHPVPFSFQRSFFRRPTLAFGSLAAALALVALVTYSRLHSKPDAQIVRTVVPTAVPSAVAADETDRSDEELLRGIDDVLADEGPIAKLIPEEAS